MARAKENENGGEELVEIPPLFHSEYSGKPFDACALCGDGLLDEGVPYLIQKEMKDRRAILECAICLACSLKMMETYSVPSRQFLMRFQEERLALPGAEDRCNFCRRPVADDHCFVHAIMCLGPWRVKGRNTVFCEGCLKQINEGLSRQTRDSLRDFESDIFDFFPSELSTDPIPIF